MNYCCIANPGATVGANVVPFRAIVGLSRRDGCRSSHRHDPAPVGGGHPQARQPRLPSRHPGRIRPRGHWRKDLHLSGKERVRHDRPDGAADDAVYDRPMARQMQPLKTMLNDVRFEQYHVFRAESHVLTADPGRRRPAAAPGSANRKPGSIGAGRRRHLHDGGVRRVSAPAAPAAIAAAEPATPPPPPPPPAPKSA